MNQPVTRARAGGPGAGFVRVGWPPNSPRRWGVGQREFPPAFNYSAGLEGGDLWAESTQVCGRAPGGEDEILQWFTLARSEFLGQHAFVAQGGWLALIAESDDGAEDVCIWNLKGLAGGGLVVAGHLVGGEAKRGGLQDKVAGGCS